MLDNIYAPFPFGFHLFFCLFSTFFLFIQYHRKKQGQYIVLFLGIIATFITQLTQEEYIIVMLGIFEIFCVISIFTFSVYYSIKAKKLKAAEIYTNAGSDSIKPDTDDNT